MTHLLNIVWNPSEGIDLGFFVIRFYSLSWLLAFALGYWAMKKIFIKEDESLEKLESLFFYTIVATMLGARLGHVIFYQPELFKEDFLSVFLPIRTNPSFEFTGFAGLASHGAAIAITIAMIYFSRKVMQRPLLWLLDRITIPVALGAVFIRIGNFFNSEILGEQTNSVFGVRFVQDTFLPRAAEALTGINNYKEAYKAIGNNPEYADLLAQVTPKHPAQLYEAFGYLALFFLLQFLYWKTDVKQKLGYIFGVFLVLLFSIRFVVEFVKESQGGFEGENPLLSTGQWLSIPFIIVGLYLIFKTYKSTSNA